MVGAIRSNAAANSRCHRYPRPRLPTRILLFSFTFYLLSFHHANWDNQENQETSVGSGCLLREHVRARRRTLLLPPRNGSRHLRALWPRTAPTADLAQRASSSALLHLVPYPQAPRPCPAPDKSWASGTRVGSRGGSGRAPPPKVPFQLAADRLGLPFGVTGPAAGQSMSLEAKRQARGRSDAGRYHLAANPGCPCCVAGTTDDRLGLSA
jgi:hypothetical protein